MVQSVLSPTYVSKADNDDDDYDDDDDGDGNQNYDDDNVYDDYYDDELTAYLTDPASRKANPHCMKKMTIALKVKSCISYRHRNIIDINPRSIVIICHHCNETIMVRNEHFLGRLI